MENRILKDNLSLSKDILTVDSIHKSVKTDANLKGKLFMVDDYGKEIFLGDNTVVFSGILQALSRLSGIQPPFLPATLNSIYGINSSLETDESKTFISLFGVGIGGAENSFGHVKDPSFKQREIIDMVPFRISETDTLADADANKYYFKKKLTDNITNAWYLKEFSTTPFIRSLWKDGPEGQDGTEIVNEIFDNPRQEPIESFIEFHLFISKKDIVDWFEHTGNITMARYNSIGLYTGQKVELSPGVFDYINLRLFSVINIENESVKERKDINYIYRIYGAV